MTDLLLDNLRSPIVLAFALGLGVRAMGSSFQLPRDVYAGLSAFLLFGIGLKGGVELSHADPASIAWPAAVTVLLGVVTPLSAWLIARRLRFGEADSAALAAHYGSVSAVTFLAALEFASRMGTPAEGFLPTLLALLESPGIHVALALGAVRMARPGQSLRTVLHEVLTGQTMVLLVGGLLVGAIMGTAQWEAIAGAFDPGSAVFKGALTLFLLEMGVVAGARLADLRKAGLRLLAFALVVPVLHGLLGSWVGALAGLSTGGAAVLGTMVASASYIAAPPAVRLTLPEANPTYYLTAALAITFPFNLLAGIPLFYAVARLATGGS